MTTKARKIEISRFRRKVGRKWRRRHAHLDAVIASRYSGGFLAWLRRLFSL